MDATGKVQYGRLNRLRQSHTDFEARMRLVEQRMREEDTAAKRELRQGNRILARAHLQRKKIAELEQAYNVKMSALITRTTNMIERAVLTECAIDAMHEATRSITPKRMDATLDRTEAASDATSRISEQLREIDDALDKMFEPSDISDSELDDELSAMEQTLSEPESRSCQLSALPACPMQTLHDKSADGDNDDLDYVTQRVRRAIAVAT